ncbi:MAG: oligosaccharide flippase family protein [Fimbriimonadales bacterium]|nr:oligosaccharide flippase family protein [Fimbriimonadales bacterium]
MWGFLAARPAIQQAGGLMMGALAGQVILLVSAPILTRLYSPADYGILASYSALVLILSVLATMRYELAMLLPRSDEEAEQLTKLALGLAAIFSLLAGLVLWMIAHWANPLFLQPLKPYIGLLTLGVLLYGASQALTYRLIRQQLFRPQAHSRWVQALVYALVQLGGGILRVGALGLLLGQVMGQLAAVLVLSRASGERRAAMPTDEVTSSPTHHSPFAIRYSLFAIRPFLLLARQYGQFPLYNMPAALLSTVGVQAPLLLAANLYSLKEAGWLVLGLRVVGAPIDLIASSLGQVYLGRAAALGRRSPAELRAFVRRVTRLLFGFALLPTLLLILIAPPLFAWLFGAEWRTSGEYLQILAPVLMMRFVAVPIAQTLVVARRLAFQLGWELLRLILVTLSFWLPATLGQPFRVALLGYAGVYTLSLLILVGLIWWSVPQRVQDSPEAERTGSACAE